MTSAIQTSIDGKKRIALTLQVGQNTARFIVFLSEADEQAFRDSPGIFVQPEPPEYLGFWDSAHEVKTVYYNRALADEHYFAISINGKLGRELFGITITAASVFEEMRVKFNMQPTLDAIYDNSIGALAEFIHHEYHRNDPLLHVSV